MCKVSKVVIRVKKWKASCGIKGSILATGDDHFHWDLQDNVDKAFRAETWILSDGCKRKHKVQSGSAACGLLLCPQLTKATADKKQRMSTTVDTLQISQNHQLRWKLKLHHRKKTKSTWKYQLSMCGFKKYGDENICGNICLVSLAFWLVGVTICCLDKEGKKSTTLGIY